jgi:hypothetical protein
MRKLAPAFIMTSVLALAGGSALANTTSKAASPTVAPNTQNPQGMSYSDKGSTEPGTNAIMDDKSKPAVAATTDDDKNLKQTKKTKKKLAMRTDKTTKSSEPTVKSDTSVSTPAPAGTPTNNTRSTDANSTTGISTGQ